MRYDAPRARGSGGDRRVAAAVGHRSRGQVRNPYQRGSGRPPPSPPPSPPRPPPLSATEKPAGLVLGPWSTVLNGRTWSSHNGPRTVEGCSLDGPRTKVKEPGTLAGHCTIVAPGDGHDSQRISPRGDARHRG